MGASFVSASMLNRYIKAEFERGPERVSAETKQPAPVCGPDLVLSGPHHPFDSDLLEARRQWDYARIRFEEARKRLHFEAARRGRVVNCPKELEARAREFNRANDELRQARDRWRSAAKASRRRRAS